MQIASRITFVAVLSSVLFANTVHAEVLADQAERAKLLRKLLEDAAPAAQETAPRALPGAKIDAAVQANRENLQIQQFQDGQWRRLLGEQQAGKLNQQVTGTPASGAPARAMGFERDQRMRDLSMRMQQQDLQIRLNNLR